MSKQKYQKAPVTAVVIGAGIKGYGYSQHIKEVPEGMQVVQFSKININQRQQNKLLKHDEIWHMGMVVLTKYYYELPIFI